MLQNRVQSSGALFVSWGRQLAGFRRHCETKAEPLQHRLNLFTSASASAFVSERYRHGSLKKTSTCLLRALMGT